MRMALERCFANPAVTAVIIDPIATNIRAIRFYQRVGFEPVGLRRFGTDECLVMRLERAAWLNSPP
jgi:aminoglycoside 6'-N-acetyltransferase